MLVAVFSLKVVMPYTPHAMPTKVMAMAMTAQTFDVARRRMTAHQLVASFLLLQQWKHFEMLVIRLFMQSFVLKKLGKANSMAGCKVRLTNIMTKTATKQPIPTELNKDTGKHASATKDNNKQLPDPMIVQPLAPHIRQALRQVS